MQKEKKRLYLIGYSIMFTLHLADSTFFLMPLRRSILLRCVHNSASSMNNGKIHSLLYLKASPFKNGILN